MQKLRLFSVRKITYTQKFQLTFTSYFVVKKAYHHYNGDHEIFPIETNALFTSATSACWQRPCVYSVCYLTVYHH